MYAQEHWFQQHLIQVVVALDVRMPFSINLMGGGWSVYLEGTNLNTDGHTLVEIQGQRAGCTGTGCAGTVWVTLASWTVNYITNTSFSYKWIKMRTRISHSAGKWSRSRINYKWYDASTGGNLLHTGDNTYSTPTISSTTNFYVSIYNTTTLCESTRALVVATVKDVPLVTLGYALPENPYN